jgi:hypothetical protein
MWRSTRLSAIALLALFHLPASAQEAGGVAIDPEVLSSANVPVLTPPGFPFTHASGAPSPAGLPNVGSAANRQAVHQQLIARMRGDGGFLQGFVRGQPVASSRAPAGDPLVPVVINNTPVFFSSEGGPLSADFGTGNIVQQQAAPPPAGAVGPAGNVGQHQTVNLVPAAAPSTAPVAAPGSIGAGIRAARGGRTNITNGGGNTVIAGPNATAQQQVLTIAGGRLPAMPIVQRQGG